MKITRCSVRRSSKASAPAISGGTISSRAVAFTVEFEAASKANSRKIATWKAKGRTLIRVIRSDAARAFERACIAAMASARLPPRPFTGPCRVTATAYYATMRRDLDISVLLDAMQRRIYVNDRQVIEMHLYRRLDRSRPHVDVIVEEIVGAAD